LWSRFCDKRRFLDPHPATRFAGIGIAAVIHGKLTQGFELTGIVAAVPETRDFRAMLAPQDIWPGQSLIAGVVSLMGTLVGIAPLLSDEISASGPLAQTVDFEIGIHSAHFQVIRA
jgi:hypothetical protein